jgi:hypothetical protein
MPYIDNYPIIHIFMSPFIIDSSGIAAGIAASQLADPSNGYESVRALVKECQGAALCVAQEKIKATSPIDWSCLN